MPEVKMYWRGHEVEITQVIGKNVSIKRMDGELIKTHSNLRHHYTKTCHVWEITTSMFNIGRQA